MRNESSPSRHPHRIPRRSFLVGMSLLGLAGCGSSNGDVFFASGAGGPGSPSGPNGPGGGVAVQGQVNLAELGGVPVSVNTAQQQGSSVAAAGEFTALVGGVIPQLVFAVDRNAVSTQAALPNFAMTDVRGLAIYLPEQPLQVDAESTAFAIVFMSLGVLTPDPAEALERRGRIASMESYNSLLQLVRNGLPNAPLSALLANQEVQALRDKVVSDYTASAQPLARTLSRDEYVRQGAVWAERQDGTTVPGQNTIVLENYAYRFATVVREELDSEGKQIPNRPPVLTDLTGAARLPLSGVTGNAAIFGGANQLSWGTAFTSQVGAPGGAVDDFVADPQTAKVRYWIRGIAGGGGGNAPQNVRNLDLGISDFVNTALFYYFMPLLDVVSGGLAGLALYRFLRFRQFDETPGISGFINLVRAFATEDGTINAYTSLASGMSGNPLEDSKALESILIDFVAAFVAFTAVEGQIAIATTLATAATGAAGVAGVTLAASTTVLAGWIAFGLGLCAVALATVGAGAALYNLGRAAEDLLLVPYLAPVEVELETGDYEVLYERVSTPAGSASGWEDAGEVSVNNLGSFAFATTDRGNDLGQLSATRRIWVQTESDKAPLLQIDSVPGFVDNNRLPEAYRAPIALNENDEIAYDGEQRGSAESTTVDLNFRRPGGQVQRVGSFNGFLSALLPADADGKTLAFLFVSGADIAAIDCKKPLAGLAPLNIRALSGQNFNLINGFAINNAALALVNGVRVGANVLAPESTYIQYQYPTTKTPLDVKIVYPLSQGHGGQWVTINERGDIGRYDSGFLVIERKGKPVLSVSTENPETQGFNKIKMNSDGELFARGGNGKLYKFTEDRGTFPVLVSDSLTREVDTVTDFDVAGDTLGVTGTIDNKATVLILKKKAPKV